jgi:hypothetical protein
MTGKAVCRCDGASVRPNVGCVDMGLEVSTRLDVWPKEGTPVGRSVG